MHSSRSLCRKMLSASNMQRIFHCHNSLWRRTLLAKSHPAQTQAVLSRCTQFPSPFVLLASNAHSRQRKYSSQMTDIVFPDPNRPDLFYHYVIPPTPLSAGSPTFALSLLDSAPPDVESPIIIGWLPAESTAALQDFVGNPKFITLLHETIKSGIKEGVDVIWKDAALQLQHGWMHIHDQRNPPDQGRIGDPDDIIATVLVEDSKIRPETYQPMPSYRVCTSDGVMQLTPGLAEYLRSALLRLTEDAKTQS